MTQRHVPKSVDRLVDERIRQWLIEKERKPEKKTEPSPHVLTLSREVGSGGAEVSRLIATELGFDLWDREIVHAIAEKSGVRESLIATLDEHGRGLIKQFRANLVGHDEEALAYATRLGEVVHSIGQHGDAVIVGRGAQYILGPEMVLAVRLVAPAEARAKRIADREGMDLVAAQKAVTARDRDRRDFCRQHFGEDIDAPRNYDLVVNTGRVTLEQAAEVVVAAFRTKFGQP
jgi:cytidylate kinase